MNHAVCYPLLFPICAYHQPQNVPKYTHSQSLVCELGPRGEYSPAGFENGGSDAKRIAKDAGHKDATSEQGCRPQEALRYAILHQGPAL